MATGGSQESEVRSQKSGVRSQESEQGRRSVKGEDTEQGHLGPPPRADFQVETGAGGSGQGSTTVAVVPDGVVAIHLTLPRRGRREIGEYPRRGAPLPAGTLKRSTGGSRIAGPPPVGIAADDFAAGHSCGCPVGGMGQADAFASPPLLETVQLMPTTCPCMSNCNAAFCSLPSLERRLDQVVPPMR